MLMLILICVYTSKQFNLEFGLGLKRHSKSSSLFHWTSSIDTVWPLGKRGGEGCRPTAEELYFL